MEPFYPPITTSRKPKSKVFGIVILVIILVLLIITGLLYAKVWDPMWNPFRPEPEKVIDEMFRKMGQLKIVHSDSNISISVKEDSKKAFDLSLNFVSDSDNSDLQSPKSAGTFDVGFTLDGTGFSIAGEGKTIGEDIYLKITKIPFLPSEFMEAFIPQTSIDPDELIDQWIKINFQNLLKSVVPFYTPELEEQMQESKARQTEIIEKLKTFLGEKRIYIVKQQLPDQEIRGVNTYHYLIALNREEIKNIIPEFYKILIVGMKLGPAPTEEQWQQFKRGLSEQIDEFFGKIGEITSELWIGKKDKLLYRMKIEKVIDTDKLEGLTSLRSVSSRAILTLKIEIDFSNFGQTVEIEAPKSYKTLEEILGLTGGIFEDQLMARDSRRMSDMLQVQNIMEFYHVENGEYPQSITLPNQIMIGESLVLLPIDPGNGPCPDSYQWIPNMGIDSQKFCLWACLEKGSFYVVSHKGVQELDNPPMDLNCW